MSDNQFLSKRISKQNFSFGYKGERCVKLDLLAHWVDRLFITCIYWPTNPNETNEQHSTITVKIIKVRRYVLPNWGFWNLMNAYTLATKYGYESIISLTRTYRLEHTHFCSLFYDFIALAGVCSINTLVSLPYYRIACETIKACAPLYAKRFAVFVILCSIKFCHFLT